MTREIRFRGRRLDNRQWVYGHYFTTPLTDENSGVAQGYGWCFLSDGTTRHCISQDGVALVVDPSTVGQYTGLKDKNGKEIYEGDVVKVGTWRVDDETGEEHFDPIEECRSCYVVEWGGGHGYPAFDLKPNIRWIDCNNLSYIACAEEAQCQVIGNIHDNPELLEIATKLAMRISQVGRTQPAENKEIVLRLDGATLARAILPALVEEGQRRGHRQGEGG